MKISRALALLAFCPMPLCAQGTQGDYIARDFKFASGEVLPALRLHYTTLGTPRRDAAGVVRNAVMILHGTGGTGRAFLSPTYAGELFGPGKLLDTARFYVVLPDGIGHGGSSKPSDGLHARFPQYTYDDMVRAQQILLTQGLGVNHLRIVMGTSMGCMHAWVWGYTYPGFADGLVPLACAPAPIVGRNRMMRRMIMDDIRNDPAYMSGEYKEQPRLGIAAALLNDPKLLLLDEPANGLDPAGIVAMRDTLRALASQGKTVLISSHLLAEIQVMADTVGIIASGKLVREGPLKELLSMQAVVKVRVQPNQVDAAVATLAPLFAAERLTETDREEGWLTVHIAPDRAQEVSQQLAGAGIYVSGMESGTDLEMLFLGLTGGQAITGEGTFIGLGATANGSATAGKETAE